MSEALPNGWINVYIDEVGITLTGSTPKTADKDNFDGNIPFYKPTDLNAGYFLQSSKNTLSEKGASLSRTFPSNSILVTCIGSTIGKVGFARKGGATNQQINVIVPFKDLVIPEYVFWFMFSPFGQEQIINNASSTTMPILNKSKFNKLTFRLPPFNEQKRISDKLDCLLAKVNACKTRLDKVPEIIKRFRQSVLADAVTGKLTEHWRIQNANNLEQSSILLDKIELKRQKIWGKNQLKKMSLKGKIPENDKWKSEYKKPEPVNTQGLMELPIGWEWASADSITSLITDGKHGDCKNKSGSGYYFLSVKDIYNGKLNYENAREITRDDFFEVHQRTNLEFDDVLITNAGTIGRVAIAKNKDKLQFTTFQKSVAVIKPIKNLINSEYFSFFTEASVNKLQTKSSGTAVKNLLLRDLKNFAIALPSLEEQNEIASRVEALFVVADTFTEKFAPVQKRVDNLTASILSKAFRGELVPQDPNDEPAELLLKRLRAEREALATNKKKGGRTPKKSSGRGKKAKPPKADAEVEPEPEATEFAENGIDKEKDREVLSRKLAVKQTLKNFEKTDVLKAFRKAIFHQNDLDEYTLLRLVGQRLGVQRLSKPIRQELEFCIPTAIRRKIIARNGDGFNPATPTIHHYDEDYLIKALKSLIRKGYEYQRGHAVENLAVYLGYDKISDAFAQRMKTIFRLAIRRGEFYRNGAYIGKF